MNKLSGIIILQELDIKGGKYDNILTEPYASLTEHNATLTPVIFILDLT